MIPWNKWKWEYNNPKFVGHRGSIPKREILSITGLPEKQEKAQINTLTSHLKELEKQQRKPKISRGNEIIKIELELNEIENKKAIKKVNATKSSFFGNLNKFGKPWLDSLWKEKRFK